MAMLRVDSRKKWQSRGGSRNTSWKTAIIYGGGSDDGFDPDGRWKWTKAVPISDMVLR